MRYSNICEATFVRRLNRFVAEVELSGRTERVHLKNTGRLERVLVAGTRVFLFAPGTPNRKTTFDLVAAQGLDGALYNVDSQATNVVVGEWLKTQDTARIVPEYRFGDSRIDFYVEREVAGVTLPCLIEVKGCTLVVDGVGYFPDAPTSRGARHLRELMGAASSGTDAAVAFVVQVAGVDEVRPNAEIDPVFARTLESARECGVRVLTLPCRVEPDALEIVAGRRLWG